jgi:hypothetical protein
MHIYVQIEYHFFSKFIFTLYVFTLKYIHHAIKMVLYFIFNDENDTKKLNREVEIIT